MRRVACVVLLLASACSSSNGPADLGTPDLGPSDGGSGTVAVISATPDLVGFVTRLDGSGSKGQNLTYAWHFVAVPQNSAITDASLSSTTSPTPSFDPDLGGVYQIQLTVTAPEGVNATTTAQVTVPTLPVFYREAQFPPSGDATFAIGVVRSDGTGAHRVSCAVTSPGPGDLGGDDLYDLLEVPGLLSLRIDDPPGAPSRVAYEDVAPMIAGGKRTLAHSLWITDENGDCTAHPPIRLDDGAHPGQAQLGPRFSPDHTRVAWVDSGAQSRLITAAVDGTGRHVVRTGRIVAAPPVWVDATHVAWVEDLNATAPPHLTFQSAADADGAGDSAASSLLDCPPTGDNLQVVNQFERLSSGALLVAGGQKSTTSGGAISLYQMSASCSTGAAKTLVTPGAAGDAWDFQVAPDGVTVALSSSVVQVAAPAPQHDIVLAYTDGRASVVFSGSDALLDDVGPRWVAAGRQLTWTQAARPDDGGATRGAGVLIADLNGTHLRSLRPESSGAQGRTALVGGSNRGYACDYGDSAPLPLLPVLLLIALLGWRRLAAGSRAS